MPDEQNYTTHLLSVDEAVDRLGWVERVVVHRAYRVWQHTLAIQRRLRAEEGPRPSDRVRQVLNDPPSEPGVPLTPTLR